MVDKELTQPTVLRSVREIVDAFGGTKACAEWAGTKMPAISNWLAEGEIPPGWHYRLDQELRRRGYVIDSKLFYVDHGRIGRFRGARDHAS